ncbi:hypothetical protein FB559_0162 [Actinoallomurus bryophytorum]|uniref:DDE family transposase n=1 Tax=Actinoallomurus bryophytorum TaxID=1490222 RepID=A0A543CCG0_9ACTN|nr:hypothetical protein FB559_0162 [Actinoallomurus bryophytorum]
MTHRARWRRRDGRRRAGIRTVRPCPTGGRHGTRGRVPAPQGSRRHLGRAAAPQRHDGIRAAPLLRSGHDGIRAAPISHTIRAAIGTRAAMRPDARASARTADSAQHPPTQVQSTVRTPVRPCHRPADQDLHHDHQTGLRAWRGGPRRCPGGRGLWGAGVLKTVAGVPNPYLGQDRLGRASVRRPYRHHLGPGRTQVERSATAAPDSDARRRAGALPGGGQAGRGQEGAGGFVHRAGSSARRALRPVAALDITRSPGPGARRPPAQGAEPPAGQAEPVDHALGRSQGGTTTKIHLACEGHGRPLSAVLTGGNGNDYTMSEKVMAGTCIHAAAAGTGMEAADPRARRQGLQPPRDPHPPTSSPYRRGHPRTP